MGQGEEERKNALEKRTLVANGFRLDDAIRYCVHQVFLEAVMQYSVCIYPSSLIIQRCISAMTTPPYEFATRPKKNEFSRPCAPSRVSPPIQLFSLSGNDPNIFAVTVSSSHKEHRLASKGAEPKPVQENAWNPPAATRLSQPIERVSKQRDWGLSKKVYIIGTTTTRLAFGLYP